MKKIIENIDLVYTMLLNFIKNILENIIPIVKEIKIKNKSSSKYLDIISLFDIPILLRTPILYLSFLYIFIQ